MVDYTLDFLERSWVGAGSDLEFNCFFGKDRIEMSSLTTFLAEAASKFTLKSLRFTVSRDLSGWTEITNGEAFPKNIAGMREILKDMPTQLCCWFNDKDNPELWFYMWILESGWIEIGATSKYFYSGSVSVDRRRAQNIVDLVFLATSYFGDAIADFAMEGPVQEIVQSKIENNEPPNITKKAKKNYWIGKILQGCEELRLMSISAERSSSSKVKFRSRDGGVQIKK